MHYHKKSVKGMLQTEAVHLFSKVSGQSHQVKSLLQQLPLWLLLLFLQEVIM